MTYRISTRWYVYELADSEVTDETGLVRLTLRQSRFPTSVLFSPRIVVSDSLGATLYHVRHERDWNGHPQYLGFTITSISGEVARLNSVDSAPSFVLRTDPAALMEGNFGWVWSKGASFTEKDVEVAQVSGAQAESRDWLVDVRDNVDTVLLLTALALVHRQCALN